MAEVLRSRECANITNGAFVVRYLNYQLNKEEHEAGANKKNKTIMTFESEPCAMVKSFIDFRRQRQISGQTWTYHNTQAGLRTKTSEQVFWQSASRHPQWHTLYEVPKSTNLKATNVCDITFWKFCWACSTVMVGIVPILIKAIVLLLRCHWRHVSNAKYGQMALWMMETNTSSMILKNSQIVTTEWKPPTPGHFSKE